MQMRFSQPEARSTSPSAAVVLPLPFPVLTITNPFAFETSINLPLCMNLIRSPQVPDIQEIKQKTLPRGREHD
jgi:hypothetical protein